MNWLTMCYKDINIIVRIAISQLVNMAVIDPFILFSINGALF